ncbi:MAG: 4Fe-4S dicluster domain-containing protein [Deltaproteobacteria bacterium]
MDFPRIAPKRALVQWLSTILLIGIPFVRVGGESLLRLDAASRTLFFFGAAIRIEEFYLFLLAILVFLFAFLFVTMVLGRVWCGWFCPQTTMTDLAEFIELTIGKRLPASIALAVKYMFYLVLSFLVAANLIWYFIPPREFLQRLMSGELGMVAGISLVSMFFLILLDLSMVRRAFCRIVCPYGRLQMMTMDRNTLTLEFNPEVADNCVQCNSCRSVCPMGIDIKEGLQIECINCGRCLDACREVMYYHQAEGLIHYTFGQRSAGGGQPFNGRSLMIGSASLLLLLLLAVAVAKRSEATIKLRQAGTGLVRRMPDGALVNFYNAYIENRSRKSGSYELSLEPPDGYRVYLLGPVKNLNLSANDNRRIDFAVKISPPPSVPCTLKLRLLLDGRDTAATPLTILVN